MTEEIVGGPAKLALGQGRVSQTMLGVQIRKIRPCDLRKVGEELVTLISWPGNGAEVGTGAPASQTEGKICFSIHKSFSPQIH